MNYPVPSGLRNFVFALQNWSIHPFREGPQRKIKYFWGFGGSDIMGVSRIIRKRVEMVVVLGYGGFRRIGDIVLNYLFVYENYC